MHITKLYISRSRKKRHSRYSDTLFLFPCAGKGQTKLAWKTLFCARLIYFFRASGHITILQTIISSVLLIWWIGALMHSFIAAMQKWPDLPEKCGGFVMRRKGIRLKCELGHHSFPKSDCDKRHTHSQKKVRGAARWNHHSTRGDRNDHWSFLCSCLTCFDMNTNKAIQLVDPSPDLEDVSKSPEMSISFRGVE